MKDWLKKAREHWNYKGDKRPSFAIEPKKGQRSVWDFPRPPVIEKVNKAIVVKNKDTVIAEAPYALTVLETASPPTYYIPIDAIDMNVLLKLSGKQSFCEWKGAATYWVLKEMTARPVAWSYAKPFPEFAALKEHLAFYPQYLQCFVDGERVLPQSSQFYAGWITPDLVGPFKGEKGTEHW